MAGFIRGSDRVKIHCMNHDEMTALIRGGVPSGGGAWADLGAGSGNFSFALRELLGSEATIWAVDRDARAVAAIRTRLAAQPTGATIIAVQAEVERLPALPPLDGIMMANLLHFVRDQTGLLRRLAGLLKTGGRVLVVEYEQALPIPWVPFPVSFARLQRLSREAGLAEPTLVGTRRSPSSGRSMYAAVCSSIETGNAGKPQRSGQRGKA